MKKYIFGGVTMIVVIAGVFVFHDGSSKNNQPGQIDQKYCEASSDCKMVCGCGCINAASECEFGVGEFCRMNPNNHCACIENKCEIVETFSKSFIEKIVKARVKNDPTLCGGEDEVTKVKMYPMFDLNGVVRKYWREMICDKDGIEKTEDVFFEDKISNLKLNNYYSSSGCGFGPTGFIENLISLHEKKHPEDQEIKAIKFFSFCAFDVFSEIKTIQNVYYYGEEDVGDGEMPFLKEMTREEIEKYDKENEFSLIKDPEKLSEIQTKLDNWIKEYENIEDKDWIEIEFMDEYIAPKNLVSEQRPAFSNLIDDFFKQCDENLDCVLIGSRLPCTLVDSINSKFYEKWVQWFADTELTNEERQWNLEFGPNYMCGHSPSLEEVEAVCENNLCQVREK